MNSYSPQPLRLLPSPEVIRSQVNTKTPGDALVTQVFVGSGLIETYTGADRGTGAVTVDLPTQPGSAGKTFTTVVVDNYGRVISGTEGSLTGDYILNNPGTRQVGGFVVDSGDITSLLAFDISATTITVATLILSSPLGVASGGTGVVSATAHYVFSGPTAGSAAPGFRLLVIDDLPVIPFSKLDPHPTTVVGYGITDVYDKTTSDARFAASSHTHSGYEATVVAGTTSQYYRGDKTWVNLTTDVIQETGSKKYYTDALARASISITGTNLQYSNTTGVLGFTGTPEFSSVLVDNAPTLSGHATNKQYVDSKISDVLTHDTAEVFNVVDSGILTYTLTNVSIQPSLEVYLNGLECRSDVTLGTQSVIFNIGVVLTIGDIIVVKYKY